MDRKEVEELYRQYGSQVYRRANNILRNQADAHDAMQEVFATIIRKGDSYRKESQIMTWIYSVTTHYCLNKLRNRKRRQELIEIHYSKEDAPDLPSPELCQMVHKWLDCLPEEQAQIAIYFYYDEMTHDEISKILGCSRRKVGYVLEQVKNQILAKEKSA